MGKTGGKSRLHGDDHAAGKERAAASAFLTEPQSGAHMRGIRFPGMNGVELVINPTPPFPEEEPLCSRFDP
jgi:hypothetical protein